MARYSLETNRSADEVLDKARKFFGEGGIGLEAEEQSECCVNFEGGGGFVTVTVDPGEKKTGVEIETREWDHQVKQFVGQF